MASMANQTQTAGADAGDAPQLAEDKHQREQAAEKCVRVPLSAVEERLPPGNRICRKPLCYQEKLQRWRCKCKCTNCGEYESLCECLRIPPYDVYPIKMKELGEKNWHCAGYQRDFHCILQEMIEETREFIAQS